MHSSGLTPFTRYLVRQRSTYFLLFHLNHILLTIAQILRHLEYFITGIITVHF